MSKSENCTNMSVYWRHEARYLRPLPLIGKQNRLGFVHIVNLIIYSLNQFPLCADRVRSWLSAVLYRQAGIAAHLINPAGLFRLDSYRQDGIDLAFRPRHFRPPPFREGFPGPAAANPSASEIHRASGRRSPHGGHGKSGYAQSAIQ